MLKNALTFLTIGGLTLLAVFIWDTPPQNLLTAVEISKPEQEGLLPHSILINSTNRQFDEKTGKLSSVLTAKESRHYTPTKQQSYSLLSHPDMTLHSSDSPPWHITALKGEARNNGETIVLNTNVHILQTQTPDDFTELTTEYLVIKPEPQYAETDKTVKINSPGNQTTGTGMQTYLKNNRIILLSDVRGIHEP